MKKIIYYLVSLSFALVLLTSCTDGRGGINEVGDQNGNLGGNSDSKFIWGDGISVDIVAPFDELSTNMLELYDHIYVLTGKAPKIQSSPTDAEHSIFVGRYDCEISRIAYEYLEKYTPEEYLAQNEESAYVIIAKDGDLAVAFNDICARDAAVEYIILNLTEKNYNAGGLVAKNTFSTEEFIEMSRSESQKLGMLDISEALGEEATEYLANIYSMYGDELYVWMADLYDPDIGGFYYSNSARNTDGFLPDIESTYQILSFIEKSGLAAPYENSWTKMLSDKTKEQLLNFTRSLQSEKDGYFYHPQWGTSISKSRRGRDHGWARRLIQDLGAEPYYPYATDDDRNVTVSHITGTVGYSMVEAVSKVVPTATDPELTSEEAFIKYLDNMNLSVNSYSSGNVLNSRVSEIKKAGLWDVLINYLTVHQYAENGLWEPDISYNSINGLMKISGLFGSHFPNAENAIESVMKIITLDMSEDVATICFVYNPWVCLSNLLSSCSAQKVAEYRKMLISRAPELILKTRDKLTVFAKQNGGFSMNQETSSSTSQGALTAVAGSVESDVNASSIAVSTVVIYMMDVFDLKAPPIYTKYDSYWFLKVMGDLGTPIKDPLPSEKPETVTFDDYDEEDETENENETNGVVFSPAPFVQNNIGDEELGYTIDNEWGYKWFFSRIVDNPDPRYSDKVLYVGDYAYDINGDGKFNDVGGNKEIAVKGSNTECYITNYGLGGNCFILDTDVYFEGSDPTEDPVLQIMFARNGVSDNSVVLDLYTYQRYGKTFLRISENYAGSDGIKDSEVAGGIPTGEWFNLRVEVYKDYNDLSGALEFKIKIYVNGEYAGVCDSAHHIDGVYQDKIISSVKFSYYRFNSSAFYFNNVYVANEKKLYAAESVGASVEDGAIEDKAVYDLGNGIISKEDFFIEMYYRNDGTPTPIDPINWTDALEDSYGVGKKSPGVRFYCAADPKNATNKVLKVYTWNTDSRSYNSTIYVNNSVLNPSGKTYIAEFDYYFETIDWLYEKNYFSIEFQNAAGSKLAGLSFAAKEIPETNKHQPEMQIKTDDGSVVEGITLKSDTWYTFRVEYYCDVENSASANMKIYLFDAEENFACIFDKVIVSKSGYVTQLGFVFSPYKIRGVQYIDDISFVKTDKAYFADNVVNGDDVILHKGYVDPDESLGGNMDGGTAWDENN